MHTVRMQWCVSLTMTKSLRDDDGCNTQYPVIFVSGGPMEAGKTKLSDQIIKLDLVDAMIQGADHEFQMSKANRVERSACSTCGSCSGMFTANSMELSSRSTWPISAW